MRASSTTMRPDARSPWIAAVVLVLAGCLIVGFEARHLTFNTDDWQFILERRGFNIDVFLAPHVEHLSALPILAFKVILQLFGATSYAPFMAFLLFVHGVACLLLYAVARRRLGPWAALVPAAILVVLGPAWQDLLWAFQVGYIGSVAAGLGMILCLEPSDHRSDGAASALLVVSLLCSSVGLGMALLAAVLLGLQRPRAWRRLWIVVVPLALYAMWYAAYGVQDARSANIVHIPRYVFDALSAALASITGLGKTDASPFIVSTSYGRLIAVAAVALLVLHLVRGGRVPALTWAASVAALALWMAACLSYFPSREAQQSRYQYAAAALVLLAITSVASGWRPTVRSGTVLGAVTLFVVGSNISMLHQRGGFWTKVSAYTAAEAGAMEVARDVVAPDFMPNGLATFVATGANGLFSVAAGPYFSAIDSFGSAADSHQAILRRPEKIREAADLILVNAERLSLQPVGTLPVRGAVCRSAPIGRDLAEMTVGPGTLSVRVAPGAPAELQLRRFASGFRFGRFGNYPAEFRFPRLDRGVPLALKFPQDRSSLPWRVRVVGGKRVRLCFAKALSK